MRRNSLLQAARDLVAEDLPIDRVAWSRGEDGERISLGLGDGVVVRARTRGATGKVQGEVVGQGAHRAMAVTILANLTNWVT